MNIKNINLFTYIFSSKKLLLLTFDCETDYALIQLDNIMLCCISMF